MTGSANINSQQQNQRTGQQKNASQNIQSRSASNIMTINTLTFPIKIMQADKDVPINKVPSGYQKRADNKIKEIEIKLKNLGYWISGGGGFLIQTNMKADGIFDEYLKGAVYTFQIEHLNEIKGDRKRNSLPGNFEPNGEICKGTYNVIQNEFKKYEQKPNAYERPGISDVELYNFTQKKDGKGKLMWKPDYTRYYEGFDGSQKGTFFQLNCIGEGKIIFWNPDYNDYEDTGNNYLIHNIWGSKKAIGFIKNVVKHWMENNNKEWSLTINAISQLHLITKDNNTKWRLYDHFGRYVTENGKYKLQGGKRIERKEIGGGHPFGNHIDFGGMYCNFGYNKIENVKDFHKKSVELVKILKDNGARRIVFNCKYVRDTCPDLVIPLINHHHHMHVEIGDDITKDGDEKFLCRVQHKNGHLELVEEQLWDKGKTHMIVYTFWRCCYYEACKKEKKGTSSIRDGKPRWMEKLDWNKYKVKFIRNYTSTERASFKNRKIGGQKADKVECLKHLVLWRDV